MKNTESINKQIPNSNLDQQPDLIKIDLNEAKSLVESIKLADSLLMNPHNFINRQQIKKDSNSQLISNLPVEKENNNKINEIPIEPVLYEKLPDIVISPVKEKLPEADNKQAAFNEPTTTQAPLNAELPVTFKNIERQTPEIQIDNLPQVVIHLSTKKEEKSNTDSVKIADYIKNEVSYIWLNIE